MFGYLLLGLSLAAAVALLAAGLASNNRTPVITTDAEAQSCCWAPKGDPTRCYPCRPTRDTR
jgi:hypothetical protein